MRRGAFAPPKEIVHAGTKDEDEISIRTASTTLYMNSNLRKFFTLVCCPAGSPPAASILMVIFLIS